MADFPRNVILDHATGEPASATVYLGFARSPPEDTERPRRERRVFLVDRCPDNRFRAPKGSIAIYKYAPWAWKNLYGGRRWTLMRRDPTESELYEGWGMAGSSVATGPRMYAGSGDPTGVVIAPRGSMWIDSGNESATRGAWFLTNGWEATDAGWRTKWRRLESPLARANVPPE